MKFFRLTRFLAPLGMAILLSEVGFALTEACGVNGVNAYAVHAKGITGDGVNIALLSTGNVRQRHAAFERQDGPAVSLYDFTEGAGLSWNNHDTHIAGIITSGGSPSYPEQIGVAPGAKIHSGRIVGKQLQARFLQEALDTLILQKNCRVIVTGIQLASPTAVGNGQSFWTELYDYYAEKYDVIFAPAAGNDNSHVTIFGDMYNGITTSGLAKHDAGVYRQVGRVANPGPTVDGRQKPDVAAPTGSVTAPGSNGDDLWTVVDPNSRGLTSYAIPFTAGTAALLLEAAGKSGVEDDDRSEVIKAVIINSTTTNVVDKKGINSGTGWNADYGYGRLNALRAWETLSGGRILPGKPTQQEMGWAYGVMDGNAEHTYVLTGRENLSLKVTVTWHRKIVKLSSVRFMEAEPFYLHLKVVSPSGRTLVFEIPDQNNLIKITHLLTENGEYKLVLQNPTATGERDYGLAFELSSASDTVR